MADFRVILYRFESPKIKVMIEAFFEGEELHVEGYDIGKSVKEYWGDSDYEYSIFVTGEDTRRVFDLYGIAHHEKQKLLNTLTEKFNTNSCYSDFRNLLDENGIPYKGFSWT